MPAR
jgi:hypothetical protein